MRVEGDLGLSTGVLALLALVAVLALGPAGTSAAPLAGPTENAFVHWSGIASPLVAAGRAPAASSMLSGMVHGAMYDAMAAVVRLVAWGGEEPRLNGLSITHALDPPAALGEPDVAQAAPEETALIRVLRDDAECAEPPIDSRGIHALAVVGAHDLVPPVEKTRDAQALKFAPPGVQEVGVRRAKAKVDPTAPSSRCGDRGVGVRHELRDDLGQVDPGLSKVLAEVAAPYAA